MRSKFSFQIYFGAALINLCAIISFPLISWAQSPRAVEGEAVSCKVSLNRQEHNPRLDQTGGFDRVSNIPPLSTVAIEVSYPAGNPGDRVAIASVDGGKLDNGKTIKVVQLDPQKKISFSFQVTSHPGMYRITLRKGNDEKTIRLWVGEETPVSSK